MSSTSGTLFPSLLGGPTQAERDGQAVIIWTIGMYCIFGWDYLMNLPHEIMRIWKRKFTYVSALYVANRYYGLLQFAVVIPLVTTPITHAITRETCEKIFLWQPIGALISNILSQAIMGGRVYAIYGQSKIILGILASIVLAELVVHIYTITTVYPAPSPPDDPDAFVPCVAVGPTEWLITFWVMPLLFDTVTFFMTLYKTIEFWRVQMESSTLALLFRDGLIYFAAIFSMNLVNVVLFITQGPNLQAVNLPATIMLNIIMSCRLVLNLRAPRTNVVVNNNSQSAPEMARRLPLWNTPAPPPQKSLDQSAHSRQSSLVPPGAMFFGKPDSPSTSYAADPRYAAPYA